jgi:nicotinamide-nucleotide amidase
MTIDPKLEADLRGMFATRNSVMPERNLKQASLIPSARPLLNPLGTAPGWFVQKDGHIIVAMPGVPREMFRMWEEEAIPCLGSSTGGAIFTRILRVSGMGESLVEERLQDIIHSDNPTVATYAKSEAVDVRVTAKASSLEQAQEQVAASEVEIRKILGHHVFGVDKETLQGVVGAILKERGQTLGVMESLTGGLISSTITNISGSSAYFVGGLVTYSARLKAQMGVPQETLDQYGVISEETARAMAHAARERLGADYGLGITGVAGPDLEEGKPVGTMYIAVEGPDGTAVSGMGPGWRGGREDQKRVAVLWSLNLLRLFLLGIKKGV